MNDSTAFLYFDIELSYGDYRDRLVNRMALMPSGELKQYDDAMSNVDIIKDLLKSKIKTVYVWNLKKWAMFTDTEVLRSVNFVLYEDLRKQRHDKLAEDYEDIDNWFHFQPSVECFNYLTNGNADFSRGYFYRVEKTYKRKKVDGHGKNIKKTTISSCLFFGMTSFFGKQYTLESCSMAYFGNVTTPCNDMLRLFNELDSIVYDATKRHILRNGRTAIPNFVTIGAIAKKMLLKSCGFGTLKGFHAIYDIPKDLEIYFRQHGLSTNGLLYFKFSKRGKVLGNVYKLDKNSLYLYNARRCPMLGTPEECDVKDIGKGQNIYEYIIEFEHFSAFFHNDKPNILSPFTHYGIDAYDKCGQIFEMKGSRTIIFFKSEWDKIREWADVYGTPIRAWRCIKNPPIFTSYCDYWYNAKCDAKKKGNKPLYQLAKLFCVSPWGKLQQQSIFPSIQIQMDIDGGGFDFIKDKENIIDEWEKSHFYFVQGAYIYSQSRVDMMNEMDKLSNAYEDLLYTDTDSIVTQNLNGDEFEIDDFKLGAFKVEEFYEDFKMLGFKTYGGITANGISVTCAGVNKTALKNEIEQRTSRLNFLKWFVPSQMVEVPLLYRKNGGALYKFEQRKISELAETFKGGVVDKEI